MDKKMMSHLIQEKRDLLDSITRKEMGSLNHKNIIIIDDSPETITVLSHYLKTGHDYSLKTYLNEFEALQDIAKEPPDLIVMDIGLETINGMKLTRLIQNLDSYKGPIIYISGNASYKKDLNSLFEQDVPFFLKPIDRIEFLKTVEKLLAQ